MGVPRSHVAVHNWVQKAELQPISTVSANQLAVDEKMIRLHDEGYWLYAAVDPEANEFPHLGLFSTTTEQTTRWFLDQLHRRYQLDDVLFLVDYAEHYVRSAGRWLPIPDDLRESRNPSNMSFEI